MSRWIVLLLLSFAACFAHAVEAIWDRTYNGPGNGPDQGYQVRHVAGGVYLLGNSRNTSGRTGVALVKYNEAGQLQWQYRLDLTNGDVLYPYMDFDGQGNPYVLATVSTNSGATRDLFLTKLSSSGQRSWDRQFSPPNHTVDDARGLVVDGAGNSYVLSESTQPYTLGTSSVTNRNIVTTSYDTNGTQRWVDVLNTTAASDPNRRQNDNADGISRDSTGNIIVAGHTEIHLSDQTMLVINKLTPSGSRVWTRTYRGVEGQTYFRGWSNSVTTDPGGSVILGGMSMRSGTSDRDALIVKYTKDGDWFWTRGINGTGNDIDEVWKVTTDSLGRVYAAGESVQIANRGSDAVIYVYSADGAASTPFTYSAGQGPINEAFYDVIVDQAGAVHAAGVLGLGTGTNRYLGWVRYVQGVPPVTFTLGAAASFNVANSMEVAFNGDVYLGGVFGPDMAAVRLAQEPIARNDAYGTAIENQQFTVPAPGVFSNDLWYQGGQLSLVGLPSHGSVTLNANGSFSYTPSQGYVGADSFTYRITKGGQVSSVATVSITVRAILSSLTVSPPAVPGGANATGTLSLTGPAPAGGLTVQLSSSNTTFAQVPTTITIPQGETTRSFNITTGVPGADVQVTITASYQGTNRSAVLTVRPVALVDFRVNPGNVVGGETTTGTVTLSGPANGGKLVTIFENTSVMSAPSSVTVASGSRTASFTISTSAVREVTVRPIQASFSGVTKTVYVALHPRPQLTRFTVNPSTVKGGQTTTGTVTLSSIAGSAGVTVTLTSGSNAITMPATVRVPAGQSSVSFTISTSRVGFTASRYVYADYNGNRATTTITLTP